MAKKLSLKEASNGALDTDSLWNQQVAAKKAKTGKDAQEMLGIEPEPPGNLNKIHPMSMMDIVMSSWEGDSIKGDQVAYDDDEGGDEGRTGSDLSGDFEFARNHGDEEDVHDGESYELDDEPEDEDDETDDEEGEKLDNDFDDDFDDSEEEEEDDDEIGGRSSRRRVRDPDEEEPEDEEE
jgi:hypothetical protein